MRIGILGGGQLGRMMALAGYPLGLRFRFLESKSPCPVEGLGQIVRAEYGAVEAAEAFAEGVDVVTYEFENVPVKMARELEEHVPVYPPPAALRLAQDRLTEKQAFRDLDIPTTPFHPVESRDTLDEAVGQLGLPAVLKTRRFGYDGKGQAVIEKPGELDAAWARLGASETGGGGRPLILEGFVDFKRELSLIGVRTRAGETRFYPLVENDHEDGILVRTFAPAPFVTEELQAIAEGYVQSIMDQVEYVGVLALELFQEGDRLLANEVAPRVHNSGHWTQEGAWCSQFENHLRAVAGLPLGPTEARGHAAMRNVLGTVPELEGVLSLPRAKLHLYGKAPRPGRKLGHVNVLGSDPREVRETLEAVEKWMERHP